MTPTPPPVITRRNRTVVVRHDGRRAGARGSMYVLVLMTASIVTVLGASGIMVARLQGRATEVNADLGDARFCAQAAIEYGRAYMMLNPDWRTARPAGRWVTDQPLGRGRFSLDVIDPDDGDLADSDADSVLVTATGTCGEARCRTRVTLFPDPKPLTALRVPMTAGGDLQMTNLVLTGATTVAANDSLSLSASTLNATSFEYVTSASQSSVSGTGSITKVKTPRQVPNPATVFDYYAANGSLIPYGSLPVSNGNAVIQNALLTPGNNPWGAANAQGIYVIDCGGASIVIKNSRINGTLVLLNPGSNSAVQESTNLEAFVPAYPALIVKGDFAIQTTSCRVSESTAPTTNYNPAGSPYNAVADSDLVDSYPSRIKGLVYASGALTTSNQVVITGAVIAGDAISCAGSLSLTYDAQHHTTPPPGFTAPPLLKPTPGTWTRPND